MVAVTLAVGAAAGCSGSDEAAPDTVPGATPEATTSTTSDDDVFSDGGVANGESATPTSADVTAGGSAPVEAGPGGSRPESSDPEVTPAGTSTDGDVDSGDAATEETGDEQPGGSAPTPLPTEPVDDVTGSDDEAPDDDGRTGDAVDDDELDDVDDLISIGDVDDVAFCQAYANVFETFLAVGFAGAFAQIGADDPEAQTLVAETFEVTLYPGRVDDVATLRAEDVPGLDAVFAPFYERIEAAPRLLRQTGLDDSEIDELAAGTRADDLDAIDLDDVDPRVREAAQAMVTEFGSFSDFSDEIFTTSTPDDDLDERLDTLCPVLAESFETA